MRVLDWLRRTVARLAWLFRAGLAAFALGATGDVLHHALPPDLGPLLGADGGRVYLVTLAGMLLIVASLLWMAAGPEMGGHVHCAPALNAIGRRLGQ
jgi:hypothetical protein